MPLRERQPAVGAAGGPNAGGPNAGGLCDCYSQGDQRRGVGWYWLRRSLGRALICCGAFATCWEYGNSGWGGHSCHIGGRVTFLE